MTEIQSSLVFSFISYFILSQYVIINRIELLAIIIDPHNNIFSLEKRLKINAIYTKSTPETLQ
jgi:hypothetical protein